MRRRTLLASAAVGVLARKARASALIVDPFVSFPPAAPPPGQAFFNPFSAAQPASSIYVSTTGNDSNPGTQASPFRTVQKGVNSLTPGKALQIAPGTYSENVTLGSNLQGTSAAPIWIISTTGKYADVTVQPSNQTLSTFNAVSKFAYLIFQGITIVAPNAPSGDQDGLKLDGSTVSVDSHNNNFVSQANCSTNVAVTQCQFTTPSTGFCGIKSGNIIGYVITQNFFNGSGANGGIGFDASCSVNVTITNNRFTAVASSSRALQCKMGSTNFTISNNIVENSTSDGFWLGGDSGSPFYIDGFGYSTTTGVFSYEGSNQTCSNNVIHDTAATDIWFIGCQNSQANNNLCYNNHGSFNTQSEISPSHSCDNTGSTISNNGFSHASPYFDNSGVSLSVTGSAVPSVITTASGATQAMNNNVVTGGGGNMKYTMAQGAANALITNFKPATDTVALTGYSFSGPAAKLAALATVGGSAGPHSVLSLTDGRVLFFYNVLPSQFTTGNFP